MANLKGSKTHDNLKAAFAGESQANRRYLYFANKADVEGQNDVAALFRSTAEGETGHAHGHLDYLAQIGDPATDLPIGASRENLTAAVAGETHEYTDMYPGMAKAARGKASRRSPTGSRPSPRPSARTPTASRRRSTASPTEHPVRPGGPARRRRAADRRPDRAGQARSGANQASNSPWPFAKAASTHPRAIRSTGAIPTSTTDAPFYAEAQRIFDICHGCRRCVSLCNAFPTLFDLVDESKTMEVDGVAKQDYWKVIDQCYLCDVCYMTKCPYVPPHPWNVDFPHLMLRGKGKRFREHGRAFVTGCSPTPTAPAGSRRSPSWSGW